MNELFKVFLSLSISGSLLILLLLVLRPLYRRRFSQRWQYYVWLVVLLRLVIPIAPETNLMGMMFPQIERAVAQGMTSVSAYTQAGEEIHAGHTEQPAVSPPAQDGVQGSGSSSIPPEIPENPAQPKDVFSFLNFLWLIWLIVALVLMVHKITVYRSFVYYIRSGSTEVSDPDILNLLSELCDEAGVNIRVELSVNPLISSPLLMGMFRPHIVLPGIETDKGELRYVLLHELTHCRFRDMHYKWLTQTILCMHWFNPLVYLAAREINKACELACDETLISSFDEVGRKSYGATLIAALETPGKYKQSIAAVTLSESAEQLKERLESIMKFNGKSRWRAPAVICTFALIAAGAMTGVYASASGLPKPVGPAPVTMTVNTPESVSVSHTISETRTETITIKPNITSGSVVLGDNLKIKSLDINASVGNLTIKRGEQYKIEVGPKLADHAIYDIDYKNGVLRYYDDFKGKTLQINNTDEGYDITITVPSGRIAYDNITIQCSLGAVTVGDIEAATVTIGSGLGEGKISGIKANTLDLRFNLGAVTINSCSLSGAMSYKGELGSLSMDTIQAKSLVIDTKSGGIDIKNCTIDGTVTFKDHMGGLEVDGLKASSLTVNGQNGGLTIRRSVISNGIDIELLLGGAEISGDIKGNISIKKGLGGFSLMLTGSKRNDYHIVANCPTSGGNTVLQTGLTIDGKSYSYDYADTNTNAPYTMTITDSYGLGNSTSIHFS